MTEKQKKCIDWICMVLDVEYKGGDNKRNAWEFIKDNIDSAKKEQVHVNSGTRCEDPESQEYYPSEGDLF